MTRKTFPIPPGHEPVRDSEGRATGEVRPCSADIVERLRIPPKPHETIAVFVALCLEGAAEIERLRAAEREAFQKYVDANEALIEARDGVGQPTLARDKVWHTIAKEIACEEDCQKWPNGCGCAQKAADAVLALAAQPPAAPVERGNLAMTTDEIAAAKGLIGASPSSAVTEGAEEAIRDWWYSDRRQPMTSKEAAKSLIWYLAKCGFKIVREPQAGEWINEPLRNWTASTNEPQAASMPAHHITYDQLKQFIAEYAKRPHGPVIDLIHTEPGIESYVTGAAVNFAVAVLDFSRSKGDTK